MDPWKRRFLLETIISRFHVNFWGCMMLDAKCFRIPVSMSYVSCLDIHPCKDKRQDISANHSTRPVTSCGPSSRYRHPWPRFDDSPTPKIFDFRRFAILLLYSKIVSRLKFHLPKIIHVRYVTVKQNLST